MARNGITSDQMFIECPPRSEQERGRAAAEEKSICEDQSASFIVIPDRR